MEIIAKSNKIYLFGLMLYSFKDVESMRELFWEVLTSSNVLEKFKFCLCTDWPPN